ncbi:MAG: hypothetical protein ACREV0_01490 [Burkholderiales bacterium]
MGKLFAFLSLCIAIGSAVAADISGTWRGALMSGGDSEEVEVVFSAAGYPVYTYTNNSGVTREVELTQAGQVVEFVPQGGGVQRIVVESIDKQPTQVLLSLTGSFERSSRGYLDQQRESTLIEYTLVPQGLHMRITTKNVAYVGDNEAIAGGSPSESLAEGILQKVK